MMKTKIKNRKITSKEISKKDVLDDSRIQQLGNKLLVIKNQKQEDLERIHDEMEELNHKEESVLREAIYQENIIMKKINRYIEQNKTKN